MSFALPSFVEALPDGVSRVSLPTPFRVGRVNCYLLAEPPVTVIDPGTVQPGSLEELEALLNARGLGFADIDQIVVTHAHADHFGAAAAVAIRSGARIVCGVPEVPGLLGPKDAESRSDLLVVLGVPEAMARSLVAFGDAALERVVGWADPSMVRSVRDGDLLLAGGRQFVCMLSPGHAEGHLSLWDPGARVLFSGDHLLARIIPVPSLDPGDGASRRRSFNEYMAGLPRFVALDPAVVLPGHGRAFAEIDVLAARLRLHSQLRADAVATILGDGPATPFEIARRLQWQPAGARLVLGLAHARGHLDLLESTGRVIAGKAGTVESYRLLA
jgi:glyoxylase-like metal-dependent hydrolase (beta-lactamase superfamily II)